MRTNFFLFLILLLLIGVGYYFDQKNQKDTRNSYEAMDRKILHIEASELIYLKLPKVTIARSQSEKAQKLIIKEIDYPTSERSITFLIKKLNDLRFIREVKLKGKNIESFFKKQSHFIDIKTKTSQMKLRLGDVSLITGNFYLLIEKGKSKKLYICEDRGLFDGIFRNESEKNLKKYLILKDLISSSPYTFIKNNLFITLNQNTLKEVTIKNSNGELVFFIEKNKVLPPAPKNVESKRVKSFIKQKFEQTKFKKISDKKDVFLENEIASISIDSDDKSKLAYKLYSSMTVGNNQKLKGYFVSVSNDWRVYTLDKGAQDLFLLRKEDLWIKKPYLKLNEINKSDRLKFSLSKFGNTWKEFEVSSLKSFTLTGLKTNTKPNRENLLTLFQILFANPPYREAQKITFLEMSKLKEILKNDGFFIELVRKKFFIYYEQSNLFIIDPDLKLKFTYIEKDNIMLKNMRYENFYYER